jgi:hypothetical protein
MEILLNLLPSSGVTITLGALAALRVGITIYDAAVKATPSKEDDAKWQKIRDGLPFAIAEKTLYYAAGIKLPEKK